MCVFLASDAPPSLPSRSTVPRAICLKSGAILYHFRVHFNRRFLRKAKGAAPCGAVRPGIAQSSARAASCAFSTPKNTMPSINGSSPGARFTSG